MANKSILAQQPGENSELVAAVHSVMDKHSLNLDQMLPAIVISYDRKNNTATVRPLIQVVGANRTTRSRHPLTSIQVFSIGGGGFHINFPLKEGDLGWIIAADRDLTRFKETLVEGAPNTSRSRTFADGLFMPDVMRQYTISDADSDSMVIQSTDSSTRIAINKGNVRITAPTKVLVTTPLAEFTGDVIIDQKLTVVGESTLNGGVTAKSGTTVNLPSDTNVAGVKVDQHKHTNPEGGFVGPMVAG